MSERPCTPPLPHPRPLHNPPGRRIVAYRIGDFASFRAALLRPRPDEQMLGEWHPQPSDDLGVQIVEWWAYLADILTFYNERHLHEALLGTAVHPQNVRRIIDLVGYRPRPAVAATGVVAAMTDSSRPFLVPRGFAIQGRAAEPGGAEQLFEVDQDVDVGTIGRPLPPSARLPTRFGGLSAWSSHGHRRRRFETPRRKGKLVDTVVARPGGDVSSEEDADKPKAGERVDLQLQGVVTGVEVGDVLLVVPRGWDGEPNEHALLRVERLEHVWDDFGKAVTDLRLQVGHDMESSDFSQYKLLRSNQMAHLWLYHERYKGAGATVWGAVSGAIDVASAVATVATGGLGGLLGLLGSAPSGPPQDPRVIGEQFLHLEAVTRGIAPKDPILIENRGPNLPTLVPTVGWGGIGAFFDGLFGFQVIASVADPTRLVQVTAYTEEIWYANAPSSSTLGFGPPVGPPMETPDPLGFLSGGLFGDDDNAEAPIPLPHSKVEFEPPLNAWEVPAWSPRHVVVHYDWQEIGQPVEDKNDNEETSAVATESVCQAFGPETFGGGDGGAEPQVAVLIEDAVGSGAYGVMGEVTSAIEPPLVPPLRALLHLLPVSRGRTVRQEVLGSGDPMVGGQHLVLRRSPLTYLPDSGPRSTDGYRSTLRIHVQGMEWHEVPTLYGQPADARVFTTWEDPDQRTHVRFGDGVNGARLPRGRDNIVATYRHGGGADLPRPGTLTKPTQALEGLSAIRNPVPVGGGEDPDPPERIREHAPQSVLTFGRAISRDDYEAVARQAAGVARVRAYATWDVPSQRQLVKVYVGDDDAAADAARALLIGYSDPNLPVLVVVAQRRVLTVSLVVRIHRDHQGPTVIDALYRRLLDPLQPPFGSEVVQIGQPLYDSHISEACHEVPGVVAIRQLQVTVDKELQPGERYMPGEAGFFWLTETRLVAVAEGSRDGR